MYIIRTMSPKSLLIKRYDKMIKDEYDRMMKERNNTMKVARTHRGGSLVKRKDLDYTQSTNRSNNQILIK